jgi:hypothetical protein
MEFALRAEMARRAVPADFSACYLSDADWREVDAMLASGGDAVAACDKLMEILARARARLPVMRPAARKRGAADLPFAAPHAHAASA